MQLMATPIKYLRDRNILTVDYLMMLVLVVNLLWLAFDWTFSNHAFAGFLQHGFPGFYNWYLVQIHYNFLTIDLYFVIVFLAEFLIRWAVAIGRKLYSRWYYYPILHWYDVLGLFPVGYLRLVRAFRLASILYRMHRMGTINLRETYIFSRLLELKDILVEEVTDKVLLNLLDGLQSGVRKQNTGEENTFNKIVSPHRQELINWLTDKVRTTAEEHYLPNKEHLRKVIASNVHQTMEHNESVHQLESIPIVGKNLSQQLERIIADVLFNTLDSAVYTFALDDENTAVQDMADMAFDAMTSDEPDPVINNIVETMLTDWIEEAKVKLEAKDWQSGKRYGQVLLGPE